MSVPGPLDKRISELDARATPLATDEFAAEPIASGVDTERVSLGQIDAYVNDGHYAVATGSSNAYAIAPTASITAYTTGQTFRFQANHTNTGAATLNVSGVGVKTIVNIGGAALESGDLVSGRIYTATYDGTNFVLAADYELRTDLASTEPGKGADLVANTLKVFNVRDYGAVGDYDSATETDGQVPDNATDNLSAFQAARDALAAAGGGIMYVPPGDYYLSNTLQFTNISNFRLYIAPGATVRNTRYTSAGVTINITHSDPNSPIENVGVIGGGTVRNHQPDHDTLPAWQADTAYDVGDYVLNTDVNGDTRAYYCKVAGTSDSSGGPTVRAGGETDGTVEWQDADNDNAIAVTGNGAIVEGMQIPKCGWKPITAQRPPWENVWILNNKIGTCNGRGIELKGQQGIAGQEGYVGKNGYVVGNVIIKAGRAGIEVEQSSFGDDPNENCRVIDNTIHEAGAISSSAGIRVNRCLNPVVRGNKVFKSSGNGYHFRKCENLQGDVHSEAFGTFGVHMQECDGWELGSVYLKSDSGANEGFRENDDVSGGYIATLRVKGGGYDYAYRSSSPAGGRVSIGRHDLEAGGTGTFQGRVPELLTPESGTWTAVVRGSGTAGTYEIANQTSTWYRIGKRYFLESFIAMAGSLTGGGTASLEITGLPVSKKANHGPAGSVALNGVDVSNTAINLTTVAGSVGSASNVLRFRETSDDGATSFVPISGLSAGDQLFFSISFEVA